ncbi:hypothetical protein HPP92_014552 [Vanilla planifolia]|uniref:Uncharacterized protein n=1 Tax=Vanilla planifolia TaxID=51239 RepID=A0A835QLQ6_VANPL|nr:hypothetical protein HPP92_014552 [Vanilla planifolia]
MGRFKKVGESLGGGAVVKENRAEPAIWLEISRAGIEGLQVRMVPRHDGEGDDGEVDETRRDYIALADVCRTRGGRVEVSMRAMVPECRREEMAVGEHQGGAEENQYLRACCGIIDSADRPLLVPIALCLLMLYF